MTGYKGWRNVFWSRMWRGGETKTWSALPASFARRTAGGGCPHKIITNEQKEDYERRDDDAASGEGFAVGDDGDCFAQRRQPACRTSGWPLNALDRSGRCNGRPSALSKSRGDGFGGS